SLINYQLNLREVKPDVVVIMHAINDLLVNADFSYFSRGEFQPDYRHFYGPLSRLLEPDRGLFLSLLRRVRLGWYHKPRRIRSDNSFPGISSFQNNLSSL